ncbi:hypothetical protein KC336_g21053 [Hortaea werneckii]|nr:hypothetical protein KC336_g21053 [Hortaea werneckii]
MEPGLASVVPGKTIEDLARIAVEGLNDYLAEPDRIIIAIERHNAEDYRDQPHTEGCHQYAWVKGKGSPQEDGFDNASLLANLLRRKSQ